MNFGNRDSQPLVPGYGYDVTTADVLEAYKYTMSAADRAGHAEDTCSRVHELRRTGKSTERFRVPGSPTGPRVARIMLGATPPRFAIDLGNVMLTQGEIAKPKAAISLRSTQISDSPPSTRNV